MTILLKYAIIHTWGVEGAHNQGGEKMARSKDRGVKTVNVHHNDKGKVCDCGAKNAREHARRESRRRYCKFLIGFDPYDNGIQL